MCSSVVERYVDIVEVASSILAIPTIKFIFLFLSILNIFFDALTKNINFHNIWNNLPIYKKLY